MDVLENVAEIDNGKARIVNGVKKETVALLKGMTHYDL